MKTMMKNDAVTGELIQRDRLPATHGIQVAINPCYRRAHIANRFMSGFAWAVILISASVLIMPLLQPILGPTEAEIALERERLLMERQARLDEYRHTENMALITSNQAVQVARAQASAVTASAKWFDGFGVGAAAIAVLIIVLLALVAILS